MANMQKNKTAMPEQDAKARGKNFQEVALGYDDEMAKQEADRCLNCKNKPGVGGCPVGVPIPEFITAVKNGDLAKSYEILSAANALPAVCGRVCPQETQCEALCVRGKKGQPVGIGYLERFVADWHMAHSDETPAAPESNGIRAAVVGAGPAGLTCAGELRKAGFDVTVFEALHAPGGVLVYGIPEFRLPKAIVHREIDMLRSLGVTIQTDVVVGKSLTVDDLFEEGFQAVFVGSGAGLPNFMGVPGENLRGVYSANEDLTRVNLGRAYAFPDYDTPVIRGKKVAVVGGGNVAMDSARTALRLGADQVTIVYRRTKGEMPARHEELEHALEEGVKLEILANPLRYNGDKDRRLVSVTLERQKLGEPDASGRRSPQPTGETFDLPIDTAIIAIGTRPNPILLEATPELKLSKRGYIEVDPESGETAIPGVYAGGDIVTGAATVISAMGAGRRAARSIIRKLVGEDAVQ